MAAASYCWCRSSAWGWRLQGESTRCTGPCSCLHTGVCCKCGTSNTRPPLSPPHPCSTAALRASTYTQLEYITASMLSRHVRAGGARVVQLGGSTRDLYYYPKVGGGVCGEGAGRRVGQRASGHAWADALLWLPGWLAGCVWGWAACAQNNGASSVEQVRRQGSLRERMGLLTPLPAHDAAGHGAGGGGGARPEHW